jgi:hypothetical protein
MRLIPTPSTLAIALALLVAGVAHAAPATNTPADKAALRTQLAAAQADLDRAAGRVAELTSQLGLGDGVRVQRIHATKPAVGIVLAPSATGVRIAGVTPGSPAARAGVTAGDVLMAVDTHPVLGSSADLRLTNSRTLLDRLDTKTPVRLTIQRNNQTLTFNVTPTVLIERPSFAFVDSSGDLTTAYGDVLLDGDPSNPGITAREFHIAPPPGVSPQIQREVIRMGPGDLCKGKDCADLPMLAEAFRWHGLNLATVDAQLGRYFGTSSGVLVLSTGQALAGLQPGDVLRSVDGKPVTTPREAMAALEGRPAGSRVDVEYLRDRRSAHTQVTVPKAMPWRFPAPPPPPAPPAPPAAPGAPRAPMAPRPPPAPPARHAIVVEGGAPLLAAAPQAPLTVEPPSSMDDADPTN